MNRLELQYEDTAPRRTRYTIYRRQLHSPPVFTHCMNACTLAAAIQFSQRMTPRGYITTNGVRP